MTQAMRDADMEPSIIEDLVDFGFDRGLAAGIEKGIEKGRVEGIRLALAPIVHLVARRIGRPLTLPEEQRLIEQAQSNNERIADVLEMSGPEITAWLSAAQQT